MIRELYAIRHKPSGGFLPEAKKGYTSSEPSTVLIPRLFTTEGGAGRALTWWLNGAFWVKKGEDFFGEWSAEIVVENPETPRIKEDMEVIPVLLKL